jgi:flagellar biosynthesis GTPase FlhF
MPKHKRCGRKARSSHIGIRVTVADTTDIRATLDVRKAREKETRKARKARKAREREARKAREVREVREAREAREAREREVRKAREAREAREVREVREVREAREASDDEDDVPILDLVRRCDTAWRAPGRGRVYEIHKIVDWKIDAPLPRDSHESRESHESHDHRSIFFLVWWKGYALRESTWEPASGIHPVEQVRFFKAAGVFD